MFLRGLLPAERVRAVGEMVAARLAAGGWTAAGCPHLGPAAGPRAALPNTSHQLRLSADFRWQQPTCPAPAGMILGPAARPPELFSRMLGREAWWEPVPAGLTLRSRAELAAQPPRPSSFFAVDPGWQRWRRPPGTVD